MSRETRAAQAISQDASDEDLVERIAEGEAAAFRALVERHVDRWQGVAFRLLRQKDAAEDAVQDMLAQLWARPAQFRPMGAGFAAWSYRVLVNRCLDHIRARARQAEPITAEPEDMSADALAHMIDQQRRSKLAEEIARLPSRQQAALSLVYTAGLSNKDAASALDISVKALETLLVRAKRTLRGARAIASGDL